MIVDRKPYRARNGRTLYKPVVEGVSLDDVQGWCLGCGEEASGVEPDAERYKCECCGEALVFGVEELMLRGLVVLAVDEDGDEEVE